MENTVLLDDIVNKVKKIVTFFKQSNNAADELRRLQFVEGKTEGTLLKLIQAVDTRWNSTYYTLVPPRRSAFRNGSYISEVTSERGHVNNSGPYFES